MTAKRIKKIYSKNKIIKVAIYLLISWACMSACDNLMKAKKTQASDGGSVPYANGNSGNNGGGTGKTKPLKKPEKNLFAIVKQGSLSDLKNALNGSTKKLNAQNDQGETPLMLAAKSLKHDFFRTLVQYGARVDIKNNQGERALDLVNNENDRSIEGIGQEIKQLAKKKDKSGEEKTLLGRLKKISVIKRYASMANFEVPGSFKIVSNPGGGSCFFYSVRPFLNAIRPDLNLKGNEEVRIFLSNYFRTEEGENFATGQLKNMQALEDKEYAPYKKVTNLEDLADLITNSGKFNGQTFWGDHFTDALVTKIADVFIIKVMQSKFKNGKDIFYCELGSINETHVAFMKYHSDVHFEAMKFSKSGKADKYTFNIKQENLPKEVEKMIDAYNRQCKPY